MPHSEKAKKTDTAPTAKRELVERVGVAVRKMGAQSVIASRTIAGRFGMHMTDLEVLDLIFLRGAVSAGELVDATGLTSGSVTALIDRLAGAGYVARCDDPSDRRKVLVRIRHDAIEPIKATYASMQKRMFSLWSTFEPRDLEVIIDFITRSTALHVDCCKEIQRLAPPSPSPHRRPARTARRGRAVPVDLKPERREQAELSAVPRSRVARTKRGKRP
jgi:DNA-binding MarR family transcriptional regulator